MNPEIPVVPASSTPAAFAGWCKGHTILAKFTSPGLSHGRPVEAIVLETPEAALKHIGALSKKRMSTGYLNYLFADLVQNRYGGFELSGLPGPNNTTIIFIESCHKCTVNGAPPQRHVVARAAEAVATGDESCVICIRGFVNRAWRDKLARRAGWGTTLGNPDALYYPVARLVPP